MKKEGSKPEETKILKETVTGIISQLESLKWKEKKHDGKSAPKIV